jgi:hypothetical protein
VLTLATLDRVPLASREVVPQAVAPELRCYLLAHRSGLFWTFLIGLPVGK